MLGGDRGCARASPRHDSVGESVLLYVSTKPTEPTTQIGLETDWAQSELASTLPASDRSTQRRPSSSPIGETHAISQYRSHI
jgi:hypothetical protein